jgi:hypothetical protein
MHHPYLAFCISGSGELVITHQRDQDRKRPLEMEIPLAELEGKVARMRHLRLAS